jgi:hypothetical protein
MLEDDVKAVLDADTGVGGAQALLTGGIYTWEELGGNGLNKKSHPDAWTGTVLNPVCVVKGRGLTGSGPRDIASAGYGQVLELWFYDDRDADYTTIRAAALRAFTLLDHQFVGDDSLVLRWASRPIRSMRAQELNDAIMLRDDYNVRGRLE